ncbi:MAG TPA: trypsin-like peptidase domain-containing protein [Candidatus Dormibacteraeota bacterium]
MDANSGLYLPTPQPRRRGVVLSVVAALLTGFLMTAVFAVATRATLAHFAAAPAASASTSANPIAAVTHAIVAVNTTLAGIGGSGSAAGTGIIVSSHGLVLTNNHVVKGSTSIEVSFQDRAGSYAATVVGVDPADDVALIQVQGVSGLPTVTLGDSSSVRVGEAVVAIGNALGRGGAPSVTAGQITAVDQSITASDGSSSEQLDGLIQMDAAISPGDSGGALVNSAGRVIGMITAGESTSRRQTFTTVGFAIPSNTAASVARQIESGQGGPNIYVGQTGYLGVAVGSEARVEAVAPGSPAAEAGITAGSTISDIGGVAVSGPSDLGPAIWSHAAGERVQITWTDASGRRHSASVTLAAGPAA